MDFGDSLRARKTGKDGKVLLQCHLWCPDDLQNHFIFLELWPFENLAILNLTARYLENYLSYRLETLSANRGW